MSATPDTRPRRRRSLPSRCGCSMRPPTPWPKNNHLRLFIHADVLCSRAPIVYLLGDVMTTSPFRYLRALALVNISVDLWGGELLAWARAFCQGPSFGDSARLSNTLINPGHPLGGVRLRAASGAKRLWAIHLRACSASGPALQQVACGCQPG